MGCGPEFLTPSFSPASNPDWADVKRAGRVIRSFSRLVVLYGNFRARTNKGR